MKKALIIIQGVLMAFGAFLTVSLIYNIVIGVFIMITGIDDIPPQVDYCLMVIAIMVAIIPFYLWYKRYMISGEVEQAKAKDVFTLRNIAIYLMLGIGCQFFLAGVLSAIRPLFETLFSYYDETISSIFVADTIIVAVYVVILAPIVEELMLRGIVFSRLRHGLSFALANVIQAAVFGIYHWDIIQGLYAFGLGLILGYIYERTRTLLAPIFVHIIINGFGFLLQVLEIGENIPIWLAIIGGGALLAVGGYLFIKSTDSKSAN